MKVGVFGSACNPITMGHYDAITQGLVHCDVILIVPSFMHPFGKKMIDFDTRCELVNFFISDMKIDSKVKLSMVEKDIYEGNFPVYTYDVLQRLSLLHKNDEIIFLCGEDVYDSLDKFYMIDYIKKTWKIIKLSDSVKIRSTLVRNSLINNGKIDNLVSKTVAEELVKRRLYLS
jgi:nicotinate-nucleotide adenylyltransferase